MWSWGESRPFSTWYCRNLSSRNGKPDDLKPAGQRARECAVFGTFGTYYRDRREPTLSEISAISKLADVAALALERDPIR
jgi:hypothetical protein